ncbi:four-carbon acid sugar kinase family protein [Herbaspirillum lusitanum]|uniref:3-oxo-isoapionate kinase OiaK n=1 Tax=Herbaspirillum lusitanum TaxID=213312 RepID=UPI0022373643|nr:3-oxo-isoapionate kinase OiaK [Herbaspirillum lusitanum]MCW5297927.1 four-carbon acid sugar kinase family protein [Herbaspirillum lusitanum]
MNTDGNENALPAGLLLAYYGDDFTGSTDAMEVMAAAGLPTVLFLQTPDLAMLQRFPDVRCIGIAGSSRGRSPAWMDEHLPQAFSQLAALRPPLMQYKVCSTFDSSATTGSIGRAIDLGVAHMPGIWSPMIVGAPRLKRYQLFGNLFAAVDGVGYRLDRHPTMARHPVTPMAESDLRRHLALQTQRRIQLIDMVQLRDGAATDAQCLARLKGADTPVVMLDVLDEETLREAGRLVWEQRGAGVFSASSSGLQYALASYWRSRGWIAEKTSLPKAGPVPVIAAVSGSCSPVTAGQIAWARTHGFAVERLDLAAVLGAVSREAELARVVALAAAAVRAGYSPLVYSAEGPDDPCVIGFDAIAQQAGLGRAEAARRVGAALAEIMRRLLDSCTVSRVAIAGGDSSGEVAGALDISALSVCAAMSPGAPLCRAWSDNPRRDGLEVVLKGGQVGARSFFSDVLEGASPASA